MQAQVRVATVGCFVSNDGSAGIQLQMLIPLPSRDASSFRLILLAALVHPTSGVGRLSLHRDLLIVISTVQKRILRRVYSPK